MIDFPASPTVGQTFTAAGVTWTYDGAKWTLGPSAPNLITVSDTPPPNPSQGALWWESVNGQMYVFYNDGSSSQWASTTNQMGGGYQSSTGVIDGSNAASGQIGEAISSVVTTPVTLTTTVAAVATSISLTPGDWDVCGEADFVLGTGGAASVQAGINSSTGLPGLGLATSRFAISATMQAGSGTFVPLRTCRVNVTTITTYYLVGWASFTSGTCTVIGAIWARRAR